MIPVGKEETCVWTQLEFSVLRCWEVENDNNTNRLWNATMLGVHFEFILLQLTSSHLLKDLQSMPEMRS